MRSTYFRWSRSGKSLGADILGTETYISANVETGLVTATVPARPISPDEARMAGVRLIEAAVLADGDRSIRDL